jgi:hypothetical protein
MLHASANRFAATRSNDKYDFLVYDVMKCVRKSLAFRLNLLPPCSWYNALLGASVSHWLGHSPASFSSFRFCSPVLLGLEATYPPQMQLYIYQAVRWNISK